MQRLQKIEDKFESNPSEWMLLGAKWRLRKLVVNEYLGLCGGEGSCQTGGTLMEVESGIPHKGWTDFAAL